MPIGHLKLNNPQADPNPDITFIRALPGLPNEDQALKLLEAVAAQFRPITKSWGFGVNSLVEYEWNREFAGRNWNAGEIIELVLRRPDGSFAPYTFILYVMAHELAHIKEMNHSRSFQRINASIRKELAELRSRHYFGDGFWSAGRSLTSGRNDLPMLPEEEPETLCGGTVQRRRKRRRRTADGSSRSTTTAYRPRGEAPKMLGHTGRQTAVSRKAGRRVTGAGAFVGGGVLLDQDPGKSTFRRQANSKKAVAARLLAVEERLRASSVKLEDSKLSKPLGKQSELAFEGEKESKGDIKRHHLHDYAESESDDDEIEWETENFPSIEFTEEEKKWMRDDMAHWRDDAIIASSDTSGSTNPEPRDHEKKKWNEDNTICLSD